MCGDVPFLFLVSIIKIVKQACYLFLKLAIVFKYQKQREKNRIHINIKLR
jgi:hypothetical protein